MLLQLGGGEDRYEYKILELENGIKVLVSRSERAEKAAVALSVGVGGYSDTEGHAGIAHFLEHMLFMGTEMHPDENHYMEYISMHNGMSNAYTADEVTNYFYDIDAEHLRESMEIFSGFFRCPLIKEDSLKRELQAVNSEHNKNILSEEWRMSHLVTLVSKKSAAMSKFQTGSFATLKNTGRDALVEFWKRWYTPERMCIVVHGKETIEEIEQMVRENFGDIVRSSSGESVKDDMKESSDGVSRNAHRNAHSSTDTNARTNTDTSDANETDVADNKDGTYNGCEGSTYKGCDEGMHNRCSESTYNTFDDAVLGKVAIYRPAVNINQNSVCIVINMALPETITKYEKSTFEYIQTMLQGNGENSFSSILILSGMASSVSISDVQTRTNTVLSVNIMMTEDDPANIGVVTGLLHRYMEIVKKNASEEMYSMLKKIAELEFSNIESQDPLDLVESAANSMQYYPTEHYAKHRYIWSGLDVDEFMEYMDIALDTRKWVVFYRTNDLSHAQSEIIVDSIYGINYAIESIPEPKHSVLETLSKLLTWPFTVTQSASINEARKSGKMVPMGTIPHDIGIIEMEEGTEKVMSEIRRSGLTAYLVHNSAFRIKEVQVIMQLHTDEFLSDSRRYAVFIGYLKAFVRFFNEKYKIEMKSSMVSVSAIDTVYAVEIEFEGTPILIESLIDKFLMEYTTKDTKLLTLTKEVAISKFQERIREAPYRTIAKGIHKAHRYPVHDSFECIENAKTLLSDEMYAVQRANTKILVTGNITVSEFNRLVSTVSKYVSYTDKTHSLKSPVDEVTMPTEDTQNKAVCVFHTVNKYDVPRNMAMAEMIESIRSESFFNELRTQEEYGYIVKMYSSILMSRSLVLFLVQSTKEYETIRDRIHKFIADTKDVVVRMDAQTYMKYQSSAALKASTKPITLKDYARQLFDHWISNIFSLTYKSDMANQIRDITQDEVVSYIENMNDVTVVNVSHTKQPLLFTDEYE